MPATWSAAHAARAPVDPQALALLPEGARAHEVTSTDGGWRHAGSASTPSPASVQPSAPATGRAVTRVRRRSTPCRPEAAPPVRVQRRRRRHWRPSHRTGRPPVCVPVGDARRRAMAHGDAPATGLTPRRWSPRSPAPWPPRSRPPRPHRPAAVCHPRHAARARPRAPPSGVGRRHGPGTGGTWVPLVARPAVVRRLAVSATACAPDGAPAGDDGGPVGYARRGRPSPPSAPRPCRDVS